MATTSPDNIYSPDLSTLFNPTVDLAAMADSVQDALTATRRQFALPVADATARDAMYPAPVQGNRVWRLDKGWEEAYFAAYNAVSNPGGATPAGWYPVAGQMPTLIGHNKGNTVLANGSWTEMNTAAGSGTNIRNDGFTYGVGTIGLPLPGIYQISATVGFPGSNGGSLRSLLIATSFGSEFGRSDLRLTAMSASSIMLSTSFIVPATTNFAIRAIQDSGGSMSAVGLAYISATFIGPNR